MVEFKKCFVKKVLMAIASRLRRKAGRGETGVGLAGRKYRLLPSDTEFKGWGQ